MSDFIKKERQYFILASLFDSKYDSAILMNKPFRVCKNKEGSKVPYRLEVHKDAMNKTIQQLMDEDQAAYEKASGKGKESEPSRPATQGGRW